MSRGEYVWNIVLTEDAVRLRQAGASVKTIARRLNMDPEQVRNKLNRIGQKKGRPGTKK